MTALAILLGVDPELLRLLGAVCTALGGILGLCSMVVGILNRRLRLSAKEDAAKTLALVGQLIEALGASTPAQVKAIATEAGHAAGHAAAEAKLADVDERLAPVHHFFRAVEIAELHREHRPETDIIRIMEAAA